MRAMIGRRTAAAALAAAFVLPVPASQADEAQVGNPFAKVGLYGGDDLARMRAGDGDVTTTIANTQTLNATSEGNSFEVGVMTNGMVTIGGNALNGFRGVGNFVVTTGNGNIVNAPVSVIISLD